MAVALATLGCDPVQSSHVDANVPAQNDFDPILTRDLAAHFGAPVRYELLRKEPTQVGVAYPKYYAWVSLPSSAGTSEGAVRLAAIDRKRFEIADFMTSSEIRLNPHRLEAVFPAQLCPEIKRRAGVPGA